MTLQLHVTHRLQAGHRGRYRNISPHGCLVSDEIVLEPTAVRRLDDIHFVTLRSYLHALGKEHGLLLNFAKTTLEVKRVAAARFELEAV